MFRVRGRVIDAKGQPATGVNVFIGPRNPGGEVSNSTGAANYDPATGSFEFHGVTPGSYFVLAWNGTPVGLMLAAIADETDVPDNPVITQLRALSANAPS